MGDENELNDQVEIEPENQEKIYNLDDLLARVTPENIHEETDTGPAVGLEIW